MATFCGVVIDGVWGLSDALEGRDVCGRLLGCRAKGGHMLTNLTDLFTVWGHGHPQIEWFPRMTMTP